MGERVSVLDRTRRVRLLIAMVLAVVLRSGAPLSAHVRRAFIRGLAAVIVVEGSDIIRWGDTCGWKLWGAAYHVLVFVIGPLVLSKFLSRDPAIA